MTAAKLIVLGLNVSMALMVFSVALRAGLADTRVALQSPGLLARSLVAMYLVMPAIAVLVAIGFELSHSVEVALVLLALSPVPPVLPGKQLKVGGSASFVLGLLVVAAVAAIIVVPAGVAIIGSVFGRNLSVPFGVTASVVVLPLLVPVAAGLLLGHQAPRFAERSAKPVSIVALVLLLATFLPLLWAARHLLAAQIGNFTVFAIVSFSLAGLVVGHVFGGPDPDNRGALALATATRHPGVALAINQSLFPDDKGTAAAVLLYLLVGTFAAAPYVAWRRRARVAVDA
jgi:BASS family bile acid:Na+ symporter